MSNDFQNDFLSERRSGHRPFTVPEGYFDGLASRITDALPERKPMVVEIAPRQERSRLWRWLGVAACVAAAVTGSVVYWNQTTPADEMLGHAVETTAVQGSDSYIDAVADYTMMDNEDIYTYLSSNDY